MLQWLRANLVPHRMWAISLVLLAVRVTLGLGLAEAGKGKLYVLAGKCVEDPLPDCETEDPKANCAQLRADECRAANQKKLDWFGKLTLFEHKGFKLPGGGKLNFTLAAVQETGAGVAILLGFLTRFAAIPAIAVMFVAMATAHWDSFNLDFAFTSELAFVYLVLALVLAAFGPGLLSIDGLLTRGGGKQAGKAQKSAKPKK